MYAQVERPKCRMPLGFHGPAPVARFVFIPFKAFWVDAYEQATCTVGGFEGERRVVEPPVHTGLQNPVSRQVIA